MKEIVLVMLISVNATLLVPAFRKACDCMGQGSVDRQTAIYDELVRKALHGH